MHVGTKSLPDRYRIRRHAALPPPDGINVTDSVRCVFLDSNRSAQKPSTSIGYVLDESGIFRRLRHPLRGVTLLLNDKDLMPLCVRHQSAEAQLSAKQLRFIGEFSGFIGKAAILEPLIRSLEPGGS